MGETMLAAVLAAPERFELREVPRPEPGPREVRIRVEGCGICGSNLSPWQGRPWFQYPLPPGAPGHEGWGVVESAGEAAEMARGERVAYLSNSALAEYDVVRVDATVRIPPASALAVFPGEAIGCAVNAFARSDVRAGQTVAVIGIGFLGAIFVRLARQAGARVIAVGRRPFSLELARRYGADQTLPLDEHVLPAVAKLTGGAFCDRVLEAAGAQAALELAGELTRERGRLVIAGYHQDGPRQVNMQLWNWRGLDVSNAHERDPAIYRRGIRGAVRLVTSGRLDPTPLYTHRFSLDQIDAAFTALAERPDGFLKALVTW